jgi:carboxylesterase
MNLIDKYPSAKAFTLKGRDEAVLMIHGFTSTPNIFRELAEKVSERFGWEIEIPLLSGHGLTPMSLDSIKKQDWIRDAELGMEKMLIKYSRIHLVGLSLGGTLCAHLATRYPTNVASITLLAPAMFVQGFFIRQLLKIARWFPPCILKKWIVRKRPQDMLEIVAYQEFSAYGVVELDKICRAIRKTFLTPKPCLIFSPTRDATIAPKSSKWFHKRSSNSRIVELTKSPHVVFLGTENEKIFSEIISFYEAESKQV